MSVVLTFLVNTLFNLLVGLIVAKFLGPSEYGKFALAIGVMGFVQSLTFEWIRQSGVRFYSERSRQEAPEIRATLDASFVAVAAGFSIVALAFALLGPNTALPRDLLALAFIAAISNGYFDLQTAMARARFADSLYMRLIVSKNVLAVVLTAGGAWATGSAKVALVAGILSLGGSTLLWRRQLGDEAPISLANRLLARKFAGYAWPIIAAMVLYQLIPLANRVLAAHLFGFAETGRFALAYDLGLRAVQAIGSALDVLLFQIAVRAHDIHGEERAKAQVASNMAIVFAILLPASIGIWAVLPSVEQLIVPEAFRGPFAHFLGLMLPGLFCVGMVQFAINPVFQIRQKTMPMVLAALAACIADPIFLALLPRGDDASSLAVAQSLAMAVGLVVLMVFAQASAPQWPRWRDLALTSAASAGMAALLIVLREWPPGILTLLAQIVAGGGFYLAFVLLFDIANLRSILLQKLAPLMARIRSTSRPA